MPTQKPYKQESDINKTLNKIKFIINKISTKDTITQTKQVHTPRSNEKEYAPHPEGIFKKHIKQRKTQI